MVNSLMIPIDSVFNPMHIFLSVSAAGEEHGSGKLCISDGSTNRIYRFSGGRIISLSVTLLDGGYVILVATTLKGKL